ncbi:MAG TPA: SpoIIE family protein phosphatase [Thermoanaerobaculia bacterium]|nr:SpoIIE family protein phosphatase [Thermoanaerobaculia bacterium]
MNLASRRKALLAFGFVGLAIAVGSLADMFVRRPMDGIVPYPYGQDGVHVREVVHGSGAEKAGIRAGDRIEGINHRIVRRPSDASRELLRCRIGSTVDYLVARGPEIATFPVTLTGRTLGDPTYLYEAIIGILFFAIGFFVFWRRPEDEAVWIFFVVCVLFLLFFVCRLRPASYWWVDLFVQNTGTISLFLLPAAFLHFFLVFPRPNRFHFADPPANSWERPPSATARKLQEFLNGSRLLYFLIYAVPPVVFIVDVRRQIAGKPVTLLSGAPIASWVLLGDYLVLGLIALAHSAFTLDNSSERRQVMQVFFGTILGTAPFVVFGIIFPTVLHNDAYVFWGIAPMILIPLTFAYAIVRFQILNVRVIVRKSLLYTITTAVIFALYAGALAAANTLFANSRLSTSRLFFFGFFLVVIPLFEFLRRRLQTPIDKLFFREKVDYQNAVLEVSETVAGELDLAKVADYLTARLISLLRLSGAEIFLRDREDRLVGREHRDDRVGLGSLVARFLRGSGRPREIGELASGCWGDAESAHFLSALSHRGVKLLVPVLYREKLMGFFALNVKLSEEDFDRDDFLLLETLANQAATAIETARLHDEMTQQAEFRRDLEIARDIQTSLFPTEFPRIAGVRFTGGSLPARVVGGDFYDFFPLDEGNRIGFVMGDVSGKSIPASLLMVASREIIFAGSRGIEDPGALFRESNRRIYDIKRRMFVALSYFVLDPRALSLRYAIGGQPLPLLLRSGNGGPRPIEPPEYRLPLGALRDVPYDTREVFLTPGDLLFFYTDGFTEAMDARMNPFGEELLADSFARNASPDLDATASGILADVRRHVGDAEQYDDMTFLLMNVTKGAP